MKANNEQKRLAWRKLLSSLMSIVLVVGLMPLPAMATETTASVSVNDLVETTEEASDFATQRVIVSFDEGQLASEDLDNVVSEGDGTYLLQFDSTEEAEEACGRYEDAEGVEYAAPDVVVYAVDDEVVATDDAPVANLAAAATSVDVSDGIKVALIDTGAPEGDSHVVSYASSLESGAVYDDAGHGTNMLATMAGEDADVEVVSVKALDEKGVGTAATVSKGIELAVEQGADVINLSFAGKATANKAINNAVDNAVAAGATVIAAAGNDGDVASLYTPANADGSFTVGAATEDGVRQDFSNYGAAVDAYVKAASTSRAAARTSGWLSNYLSEDNASSVWEDSLRASSIAGAWEPEEDPDTVQATANVNIVLVAGRDSDGTPITTTITKSTTLAKRWALLDHDTLMADDQINGRIPASGAKLLKWLYVPEGSSFPGYASGDTANLFSADGTSKPLTSPVADATYTFYACWYQDISFTSKAGSKTSTMRHFVETADGTVYGYLDAAVPTASTTGWTFAGWSGNSNAGKTWSAKSLYGSSDSDGIVKDTQSTTYSETGTREVTVTLGAVGGVGSMNQTTKTLEWYDGADTPSYGFDTSYAGGGTALDAVNFNSYIPSSTGWTLGGFQLASGTSSVHANGPDFNSLSNLAHGTFVSDAKQSAAGSLLDGSTAPYLHTVYKRALTLRKYVAGSGNAPDTSSDYKDETTDVCFCTSLNSVLSSTLAGSTPTFALTSEDVPWPAGQTLDKWYYNGTNVGSGALASTLGFTDAAFAWGTTDASQFSSAVYATTREDPKYIVKFTDGSGTTVGQKKVELGSTIDISTIKPEDLTPGYTYPTGASFLGWSANGDLTTASVVGSTTAIETDVFEVQAVWERPITLYTGQNSGAASTNKQKVNRSTGAASLTLVAADMQVPTALSSVGWTALGWATSSSTTSTAVVAAGGSFEEASDALYAVYSRPVTLSYGVGDTRPSDATGAVTSGTSVTQTFNAGASAPSSVSFTPATSSGLTSATYEFKGWVTSASGTSPVSATWTPSTPAVTATPSFTLYDYWTEIDTKYNIRYMDGVSTVIGTERQVSGTAHTLAANPAAVSASYAGPGDGWTFAYWAVSSAPFAAVTSVPSQAVGATVSVQAVWQKAATLTAGSGAEDKTQMQYWNRSTSGAGSYTLNIPTSALSALSNWSTVGWTTNSGASSASDVGAAAKASATTGTKAGDWAKTDDGWTYTGSSNTLYAFYSRTVTLNYTHVPGPDTVSGWKSSDTATQYYRAGGSPTEVSFTLPSYAAIGWTWGGWTETSGGTTPAADPYKQTPVLTTASPSYTLYDKWTEQHSSETATYTVNHYRMNLDGTYPASPYNSSTSTPVVVGTNVTGSSQASPEDGYEFDSSTPSSAAVASGNTTAFAIKYKRCAYQVRVPNQTVGGSTATFAVSGANTAALNAAGVNAKDGQGTDASTKAAYGDTVTITPSLPSGWKVTGYVVTNAKSATTVTLNADGSGTFTMPVASVAATGITVSATLASTAATTTSYRVEHYNQLVDGTYSTTADRTDTVNDVAIGATATASEKAAPSDGFVFDSGNSTPGSVAIASDGTSVIKVYYKRLTYGVSVPNAQVPSYGTTVKFDVSSAHASALGATDGTGTGSATAGYGDTVTVSSPTSIPEGWSVTGYTVSGGASNPTVTMAADGSGTFTMPAYAVTVTATLSYSSTDTTSYTVRHYQQELTGEYPGDPYDTDTILNAEIGSTVTGESVKRNVSGFEFDDGWSSSSVTVLAGGATNVDVGYKRAKYGVSVPDNTMSGETVSFNVSSAHAGVLGATNGAGTAATTTAAYGDTVTVSPAAPGSIPEGWRVTGYTVGGGASNPTVTMAADGSGTFTMPAYAVTVTATLSYSSTNTTSYTVNHFEQELTGGYPMTATRVETVANAMVGDTVSGEDVASVPAGFKFKSATPASATIASDGTTSFRVEYERSIYKVVAPTQNGATFDVSSAHADALGATNGPGMAATTTAAYGDTVTITPSNLPEDYRLTQYIVAYGNSVPTVTVDPVTFAGTFTMPAESVTGLGIWVMAVFTPSGQSAKYTVGHYQQQLDGEYPAVDTPSEAEMAIGATGAQGTGTPKSYPGFSLSTNKPAEYGTIVDVDEDPETVDDLANPTVKMYYDRMIYPVTASVAAGTEYVFGIDISAAHASKLGSTDGVGSATAAFGDDVTVKPAKNVLPVGYAVTSYDVKSEATGALTNYLADLSGAATFAMPAGAVTVTANVGLDPNYKSITLLTGEGVTASGSGGKVVAAAKAGTFVVLVASADEGYSLVGGSSWTSSEITPIVNDSEVLVFTMPSTNVLIEAPPACQTHVEKTVDKDGNVLSTRTATTIYRHDSALTSVETVTSDPASTTLTYERVVKAGNQTITTMYDSSNSSEVGSKVVNDDGQGTVTTTYKNSVGAVQQVLVTETTDLGNGKSSAIEEGYSDAAMTNPLSGWPRTIVSTTDSETGVITSIATHEESSYTDTRDSDPRVDFEVVDTEVTQKWVTTTVPVGSTTTVTTEEQMPETVVTTTSHPATATIGGVEYDDATKVVRAVNGVPESTRYFRAWLDKTSGTAGYASEDTDVASADATITPTDTGSVISMAVTPQGGTQISGTSEMVASGRTVGGISATIGADGPKVMLSGRSLSRFDASKYWYSLIVREIPATQYSTVEKALLRSNEYFSKIAYENRVFAVSLYRIGKGANGTVAGEVSKATQAELSGLSVSIDLGATYEGKQAYVARVDGTDSGVLGRRTVGSGGMLAIGTAGGLGDFVVGLGMKHTATYHDNYIRTDGSLSQTAVQSWADYENWVTQSSGQFQRKYYALDSWNTDPDGDPLLGQRYEAGELGTQQDTPLAADVDLYAQWKADLSQTNLEAANEGTHVDLFADQGFEAEFVAPVYDTKPHNPFVRVTFNGEPLRQGIDYELSFINEAGETVAPKDVVDAGTYKVVVTGLPGDESAAAAGSKQEAEFTIAKAEQTVTVDVTQVEKVYGDAPFKITASAAGIEGGTPAGDLIYPIGVNVPSMGVGMAESVLSTADDGTVTITGAGDAEVLATAKETQNYNAASTTVKVHVAKGTRQITVPTTSITATAGVPFDAAATLSDKEGKLVFTSLNSGWMAVDAATGKVTPKGMTAAAKYRITVDETANYNAAAPVDVTVKILSGLSLTGKSISGKQKKKLTFKTTKYSTTKYNKTGGKLGTYTITNASKVKKAKVSINKKNGTLTVNKGAKGTYKINVKVVAAAKSPYSAQNCTFTVTLKLK